MKCIYCTKEFTNAGGRGSHQKYCDLNPNKSIRPINRGARKNKGNTAWNKGLTKESDERVAHSKETKNVLKEIAAHRNFSHSEESKQHLSRLAKERGLGGVTQSRWIKYKGKTLGSTYELQLAESLDAHNIKWDTCDRFKYIDPTGKTRTYTPDLYLIDYDIYVDPKNDFLINNINPSLGFSDKEKIKLAEEQNNITVLILDKTQLSWGSVKKLICP